MIPGCCHDSCRLSVICSEGVSRCWRQLSGRCNCAGLAQLAFLQAALPLRSLCVRIVARRGAACVCSIGHAAECQLIAATAMPHLTTLTFDLRVPELAPAYAQALYRSPRLASLPTWLFSDLHLLQPLGLLHLTRLDLVHHPFLMQGICSVTLPALRVLHIGWWDHLNDPSSRITLNVPALEELAGRNLPTNPLRLTGLTSLRRLSTNGAWAAHLLSMPLPALQILRIYEMPLDPNHHAQLSALLAPLSALRSLSVTYDRKLSDVFGTYYHLLALGPGLSQLRKLRLSYGYLRAASLIHSLDEQSATQLLAPICSLPNLRVLGIWFGSRCTTELLWAEAAWRSCQRNGLPRCFLVRNGHWVEVLQRSPLPTATASSEMHCQALTNPSAEPSLEQ